MNREFFSEHFTLEKVAEGIYAAIAKPGGGAVANAGFIDLGDQTIVFDTFNTQQAASDLRRMVQKLTNQSGVTWVVNSHFHGDHVRGNQVFKDSIIVSSTVTYEKMRDIHPERIHKQKSEIEGLRSYIQSLEQQESDDNGRLKLSFLKEIEASLPGLELVLPQQTFKEEVTFYGSNRTAVLSSWGGGHSYCDAVLYVPEEKVIFMGDLLFVDTHPSFFEESNPAHWLELLQQMERLDIEWAVPGHGPVGTKADLLKVREYIKAVCQMASEDPAKKIEIPHPYRNWSSPETFGQNLKKIRERRALEKTII